MELLIEVTASTLRMEAVFAFSFVVFNAYLPVYIPEEDRSHMDHSSRYFQP
jgi:hypothetical protein